MIGMLDKNKTNEQLKKGYYFLVLFMFAIFADQLAVIMEYYVLQEGSSYPQFYVDHSVYGSIELMLFGKVILFVLFVFLFAIFHQAVISTILVNLLGSILMFASRIKLSYRSELINYKELALNGAGGMVKSYLKIDPVPELIPWGIYLILSLLLVFFLERECKDYKKSIKKKIQIPIRLVVGLSCILFTYFYVNYVNKSRLNTECYNVNVNISESKQYVIYRFLEDSSQNYNEDGVRESYKRLREKAKGEVGQVTGQTPNVIVIMSEAWWNLDHIKEGSLTYSKDPMEPYHTLEEECVSGFVSSNVYGGGTVSSECEILTGINSTLSASMVDQWDLISSYDSFPSLVSYFHSMDYKTVGIHPYYGDFYNRKAAYEVLGFDKMVFDEDMKYRDYFDRFISDDSLAKQIIYEYEEKQKDQPSFIFSVSMANHNFFMDYENPLDQDYKYEIDVKNTQTGKEVSQRLKHYINGIYQATKAYESLVDYFKTQEEPTVILMFGDHSPSFTQSENELFGIDVDSKELKELEKSYTTPVLLWKNFEEGEELEDFSGENIAYLQAKLLDYAGLPGSNMSMISKYVKGDIKALSRYYQISQENQLITSYTESQSQLVNDLSVISYATLHGSQVCADLWDISQVQDE